MFEPYHRPECPTLEKDLGLILALLPPIAHPSGAPEAVSDPTPDE